jgi:hypothetical protein
MSRIEVEQEIRFGVENLVKIYEKVTRLVSLELEPSVKIAALAYECFGYYNALEHIMIRFLKYLKVPLPIGASSHKETVTDFLKVVKDFNIPVSQTTLDSIIELMAFRHVATKIYSFLIDEGKLAVIAEKITAEHSNIVLLIDEILKSLNA